MRNFILLLLLLSVLVGMPGSGQVIRRPAFSPAFLSNLKLWLKADSITGLSDGDPIETWSDSSGSGFNATQSTSAKRPVYKAAIVNNLPVVRFDGVDDYLTTTYTLAAGNNQTMFLVIKYASLTSVYGYQLTGIQENGGFFYLGIVNTGPGQLYGYFGSNTDMSTANVLTVDVPALLTLKGVSGGNAMFYLNGVLKKTASATVGTGSTPFDVGRVASGYYNNADILEILVYDRLLNDTEQQRVEGYLNGKWRLY